MCFISVHDVWRGSRERSCAHGLDSGLSFHHDLEQQPMCHLVYPRSMCLCPAEVSVGDWSWQMSPYRMEHLLDMGRWVRQVFSAGGPIGNWRCSQSVFKGLRAKHPCAGRLCGPQSSAGIPTLCGQAGIPVKGHVSSTMAIDPWYSC